MITATQQRKDGGSYGRHAGTKTHAGQPALHPIQLGLKRFDGGVNLPTVGVTRTLALKHSGEVARVVIAIGNGCVYWFVQRSMLNFRASIAVYDRAGEPLERIFRLIRHGSK